MVEIYGMELSVPCLKVRFAAHLLGVEYAWKPVNLRAGEHRQPAYLQMHPAGKVPVITEGDFVLFESNAIMKYLATKHGPHVYPADQPQRALIDQWVDFSSLHVGAAMQRVTYNRVLAPMFQLEVDARSLQDGEKFLSQFLPVIDAQLGKQSHLASDAMTVADINLLAILDPAEVAEVDLAPYHNITRWRQALQQEDFYTTCHSSFADAFAALRS